MALESRVTACFDFRMFSQSGTALLGGVLVGVGLAVPLLVNGRVAGVSGMLASTFPMRGGWPVAFLLGLVAGGVVLSRVAPDTVQFDVARSLPSLLIAGVLVGFGTRLGGGCTSGHGICGVSRLARRSLVGTMVFMVTGAVVVWVHNLMGTP